MSIARLAIQIERGRIAAFCRARGIRRLSLFGLVLRDDFDPQRSDVDVLAEFERGDSLRVISARRASRKERKNYEEES
jgi:predicted nucleotidyltransferase